MTNKYSLVVVELEKHRFQTCQHIGPQVGPPVVVSGVPLAGGFWVGHNICHCGSSLVVIGSTRWSRARDSTLLAPRQQDSVSLGVFWSLKDFATIS